MKKYIALLALVITFAACGSGTENTNDKDTMHITNAGAGTGMPDTGVITNQSGATGNGGVGTGAIGSTGETSSGDTSQH